MITNPFSRPGPGNGADENVEAINPDDARLQFEQAADQAKNLYSDPHFIWKGRLVESDYKAYFERELNPYVLSPSTLLSYGLKKALLRVVNGVFDKNTPLSNIDNITRCQLNLELVLNNVILAMTEQDRNDPQLKVALVTTQNAYYHLLTRAKGGEERKLQNKLEQSLETKQTVVHQNAPQKRGFLSFGGNGR